MRNPAPVFAPPHDPQSVFQQQLDAELRRLTRTAYITGILNIIGSFVFLYFRGTELLASGNANVQTMYSDPETDKAIGRAFIIIGAGAFVIGTAIGVLTMDAGSCIKKRRAFAFVKGLAVVNRVVFPLGTLIGISILVASSRFDLKTVFGKSIASPGRTIDTTF